jgi:hypothetical protein
VTPTVVEKTTQDRNALPTIPTKIPVHRVTGRLEEQGQMLPRLAEKQWKIWGI